MIILIMYSICFHILSSQKPCEAKWAKVKKLRNHRKRDKMEWKRSSDFHSMFFLMYKSLFLKVSTTSGFFLIYSNALIAVSGPYQHEWLSFPVK